MMSLYYVKKDLPGLPAGRVERFHDRVALGHSRNGYIEPYDEKKEKHREAYGSPVDEAKRAKAREAAKKAEVAEQA